MITTTARHHSHLDLSTCCICSVKQMMIMRQYSPRLSRGSQPIACAWSRFLSIFSALVCDQLPRRLFHGSPKVHWPKSIWVTILTRTAWRTPGLFGTFPTRDLICKSPLPSEVRVSSWRHKGIWGFGINRFSNPPVKLAKKFESTKDMV